jgi:flagellar biogenesis protein FliO
MHLEPAASAVSFVRVLGALVLVFAVLFAGVWFWRNAQRLSTSRGSATRLQVIEVKSLGPRHALYVVGYEQRRFLLSSAPSGISMLVNLPEAPVEETVHSPSPTFAETLARVLSPVCPGKRAQES